MRTQAHGKHRADFSQLCHHHGFRLRAWVPRCPAHPPAWPQLGLPLRKASVRLSPCLRRKRGREGAAPGAAGQETAAPFPPGSIATAPSPAPASSILLVSPQPPGWPACPAPLPGPGWALVHLSGTRCLIKPPRKQGQPAGAEGGPLWATSGFRAFWSLFQSSPKKTRVWAT